MADAAGPHPDENVARADGRDGQVFEDERLADLVGDGDFHGWHP